MRDQKIVIYIKNLEYIFFQRMLIEFFGRDRLTTIPIIYVHFEASFRSKDNGRAEAIYSNFNVAEASKDEDIWRIPLAKIDMQRYPSQLVVYIEGIKGKEKDWKKVENIVREIISQMEILKFEIESVIPKSLLPQSALPPWEQIEVHGADREILKLWWDGYTSGEIALKVNLHSPRTVTNKISLLRKQYGKDIVLTDEQRRRKNRPKTDDVS